MELRRLRAELMQPDTMATPTQWLALYPSDVADYPLARKRHPRVHRSRLVSARLGRASHSTHSQTSVTVAPSHITADDNQPLATSRMPGAVAASARRRR